MTATSLAALFLLIMWGTEVCSAMESSPSGGESLADTILDRVAEDRVRRFRMNYGLQEDQDFAKVMKAGGSAMADAWMEVAADVDDTTLLRAVDEAHMVAVAARQRGATPRDTLLQALQAILQGPARGG